MKMFIEKSIKVKMVKVRIDGVLGGIVVWDGVGNIIWGVYVGFCCGIRLLGYNLLILYYIVLKNDLFRFLEWNLIVMECDMEWESGGEFLLLNIYIFLFWLL